MAAREATLAAWRFLSADPRLASAIERLSSEQRDLLAGTASDPRPEQILRTGVETAGRALVQHSWLAHELPAGTAPAFARAMQRGGVFDTVAGQWMWGLQAGTYRRGLAVGHLTGTSDEISYTPATITALHHLKQAAVSRAHATIAAAVAAGQDRDDAIARHADERDEVLRQYALLDPATPPRCLAQMPVHVGAERFTILPGLVASYVDIFVAVLTRLDLVDGPGWEYPEAARSDDAVRLVVRDMSCANCQRRIERAITAAGLTVLAIDLDAKHVWVEAGTVEQIHRAVTAVVAAGYHPDPV